MSASSLYEHLSYWQDEVKVAAYAAALGEVIRPGDHVLDLGAGTGLLGMLAARAGAAKVWCYDSGDVLGIARDLAQKNGLADKIEFIRAATTDVELRPVDVIVCDQIGGLVFDAGVLEYYADARARALNDGGTLIPGSFELYLVPVEAPGPYGQVDGWGTVDGFDLGEVRRLAANTEYRVDPPDIAVLADACSIGGLSSDDTSPIQASCSFAASRAGTLHGLSGWFDATLSPSVRLTNRPDDPSRMNRWLNFYPLARPVVIEPGDAIEATIDIRPEAKLVVWTVSVNGQPAQRMSTFDGTFIFDPATTFGESGGPDEMATKRAIVDELTSLAVAGGTANDLIAAAKAHTDVFPTPTAAGHFAQQVWSLLG